MSRPDWRPSSAAWPLFFLLNVYECDSASFAWTHSYSDLPVHHWADKVVHYIADTNYPLRSAVNKYHQPITIQVQSTKDTNQTDSWSDMPGTEESIDPRSVSEISLREPGDNVIGLLSPEP